MKSFNSNMADDYNTSQSNLVQAPGEQRQPLQQQQQQSRSRQILDEMSQDLQYLSREAPLDGGESTFGAYSQLGGHDGQSDLRIGDDQDQDYLGDDRGRWTPHGDEFGRASAESPFGATSEHSTGGQQQQFVHSDLALEQLTADNVDIQRPLQQAG